MLKINELTGIFLGVRGENLARTIEIDMSPWMPGHPSGNVSIWHKRPGAASKEATGATYDTQTMVLTWMPTSLDTYNVGDGLAEIRLTDNGMIKKTKDVPTVILKSHIGSSGETLESSWQAYMNDMDAKKQAAVLMRLRAEAWAVGQMDGEDVPEGDETYENSAKYWALWAAGAKQAEITAERWAVGKRLGEDVPETDPTYHNNAKWYAQKAHEDKEYVAESAAAVTRAEAAAIAAEDAAATAQAAMEIVGETFDPTDEIKKNEYRVHNGDMYRFTNDHTGAWDAGDVEAENVTDALGGLTSGRVDRAFQHLGFYIDEDGDICQAD